MERKLFSIIAKYVFAGLITISFAGTIQAQYGDSKTQIASPSGIPKSRFELATIATISVVTVEELYSAVNNPANAGNRIELATGTYVLSPTDSGGMTRPNGGRLELQENMSLRGVAGNRGAVVIDAAGLPQSSYSGAVPNSGAIRIGNGTNLVEWLTVRNAANGGAGIIVHLNGAGTTYVRIAHSVSTGHQRGIDIRNVAAGISGFIIEAEIVDNDLHNNRSSSATGLRIINQQGASGNSISAYLSGNRMSDNQQGMIVENLGSTNGGIISVYSSGDRFYENGGGAVVGGAFGPTNNSTVNFTAVGSVFENNNGFTGFYRGGLIVAGGVSFQTANGGSNNTANATLRNCRFGNNQLADLAAFGASSLPVTIGSSGTNNRAIVRLFGTIIPNLIKADSEPVNPSANNSAVMIRTPVNFDFDGDDRADISVFRPSDGIWYLKRSTNGFAAAQFGLATDKPVPADYDGDGKTDIGIYRDGQWWWINSSTVTVGVIQFGLAGDIPQPADFDGDGRSEIATFRDRWYVFNLANRQTTFQDDEFCSIADDCHAVVNDYDGDGRADYAVYAIYGGNQSEWYIKTASGTHFAYVLGITGDKPVPADYDGDGKTDAAVFRPSNGMWYIRNSSDGTEQFINWGLSGDKPVPADYDGDGKADLAVFRNGTWWIRQSTSGVPVQQFGLAEDSPVPAAYILE